MQRSSACQKRMAWIGLFDGWIPGKIKHGMKILELNGCQLGYSTSQQFEYRGYPNFPVIPMESFSHRIHWDSTLMVPLVTVVSGGKMNAADNSPRTGNPCFKKLGQPEFSMCFSHEKKCFPTCLITRLKDWCRLSDYCKRALYGHWTRQLKGWCLLPWMGVIYNPILLKLRCCISGGLGNVDTSS